MVPLLALALATTRTDLFPLRVTLMGPNRCPQNMRARTGIPFTTNLERTGWIHLTSKRPAGNMQQQNKLKDKSARMES